MKILFFPGCSLFFFASLNRCIMKNEKKVIEIIDQFPAILYNIKMMLQEQNADHILDASKFAQPVALMNITNPDLLLLNLKLQSNSAVGIVGEQMQDDMEMKLGMITTNPQAYYISLCSSFSEDYLLPSSPELEVIPGAIAEQQLN
jgi:two-component SAPR family response regulator